MKLSESVKQELIDKLLDQLRDFLLKGSGFPNNAYLEYLEYGRSMVVYVRRSFRSLAHGKPMVGCLDIATVSIADRLQRQGLCRMFIEQAHQINPWKATFLENVIHPGLQSSNFLKGWCRIEYDCHPCFYRLKEQS